MSALAKALLADLNDDDLDTLAELLAPRLSERLAQRAHAPAREAGWLNAAQAAEYIGAPKSRVYDLVQLGKLSPRRDGRSLRFRRSDLDAYLEGVSS